MIETLRYRLLNGWNVMRFVRLVFSGFILVQATQLQEPLLVGLGGIFLFQAAFNYGCCAGGACDTRPAKMNTKPIEETEFTEIK